MDTKARNGNGSGLGDAHVADLLVFGFLQACASRSLQDELQALGRELAVGTPPREDEDQLQTDGNHCSRTLPDHGADSDSQEDVIQSVARQLAQIGDQMDHSMPLGLVHNLARRLMDRGLSEEDRSTLLAATLDQLLQTCPRDMDMEKTQLVLALLLTKKVAEYMPDLLRGFFRTTVNFINQNLLGCVRDLLRNEMD